MVRRLFQWFLAAFLCVSSTGAALHPIFVTVTDMVHNPQEQSLEITCRIFTDDFEKTLRAANGQPVDLLNPPDRAQAGKWVSAYIQAHFSMAVNQKPCRLDFIGFEQVEEAIACYFEVKEVPKPEVLDIQSNLLYEYKKEQMGIFHLTVSGERKSTRLLNPETKAQIRF